jgi:hypothetical protein
MQADLHDTRKSNRFWNEKEEWAVQTHLFQMSQIEELFPYFLKEKIKI